MITLLQLEYFRKLAAVEHITKTAQQLPISQTALSLMIINLEKELGVQLFDRTKRTIRLNETGRIYLKYVNDVFAALDNGRIAVQENNDYREHLVSMATGSSSVWTSLFHDFCKAYPQHVLKQSNGTIPHLEKLLQEKKIDLVIAGENDLNIKNIEKTWFKTDAVYLCVPQMHPLADRESIYMDELREEKFIFLNEAVPWQTFCNRLFEKAGYVPHIVLECDYTLRASLIESNFGVALTSASARAANLLKSNKFVRIADDYAIRNMYLYYNSGHRLTTAARDFLDFCAVYYAEEHCPYSQQE